MSKNDFQGQRANIIATRKLLAKDRAGDYKYTEDVLESVLGNLSTTTRGLGRTLTSTNERQLAALRALAGKTAVVNSRTIDQAGATVANRYGSAIAGGVAAPALDVAKANAKAASKAVAGQVAAGRLLSEGNAAAAATLDAGVTEAQAAAQYATAEALSYRAKSDARLVAEQQMALQQMRLQAKLDFEYFKKKETFLQKLEQTDPENLTGMTAVANTASDAAAGLHTIFNDPTLNEDGHVVTATEAAQKYIQDNAIASEAEQQVIYALAGALFRAGAGPNTEGRITSGSKPFVLDAVDSTLALLYPNYSKYQQQIHDAVLARLTANRTSALTGAAESAAETGDGTSIIETLSRWGFAAATGNVGAYAIYNLLKSVGGVGIEFSDEQTAKLVELLKQYQ